MSLANKYRPVKTEQLLGQPVAVALIDSILSKKARMYIFHSTIMGVGKTSSARILAMKVNCANNPLGLPTPCGKCSSCVRIIKGTSSDILELDFADDRGVDAARDLKNKASYLSIESTYRIFILDEFHQATVIAQNALLKLFEEPDPNTFFVLCSTNIAGIIPTIRNRAICIEFTAVEDGAILSLLKRIRDAEGIAVKDEELAEIAASSGGSVRGTIMSLEQYSSLSNGTKLILKDANKNLAVLADELVDVFLYNRKFNLFGFLGRVGKERLNLGQVLKLATETCLLKLSSSRLTAYASIGQTFHTALENTSPNGAEIELLIGIKKQHFVPEFPSFLEKLSNLCNKISAVATFTEYEYILLDLGNNNIVALVKEDDTKIHHFVRGIINKSDVPKIMEFPFNPSFLQLLAQKIVKSPTSWEF